MKTKQQPLSRLAEALGVQDLYFKREDMHPYGSHKGRAIPVMMKHYIKTDGIRSFCISSSGNAALAAAIATQKHNQNNPSAAITLTMFVGEKIDEAKKKKLETYADGEQIRIEQVERPKQTAFLLDKEGTAKLLRQSTDDIALKGYYELATELAKIPDLAAVFVPTSSGTTAQGLAMAFTSMEKAIEVHIVQTSSCHPIADALLGNTTQPEEQSMAAAIVDKVAHRKAAVKDAISETGGTAWIATNLDIVNALNRVEQNTEMSISANSALSVAGVMLASASGKTWEGPVACLICGD